MNFHSDSDYESEHKREFKPIPPSPTKPEDIVPFYDIEYVDNDPSKELHLKSIFVTPKDKESTDIRIEKKNIGKLKIENKRRPTDE